MAGSTPIYGFPYPQSTDLVADYPALGQELATDVENVISGLGSGLNLMTPTSITNSGGSSSASGGAVTFTGVNSVSLNGVFSTGYDNYRIIFRLTCSTSANINMRMRLSGTDDTSSNYQSMQLYAAGAVGNAALTSQTAMTSAFSAGELIATSLDLYSPRVAEFTLFSDITARNSGPVLSVWTGSHNVATAYDGLTLLAASGTITGKIRVYGYKN
jgi:hypothetical protein